MAYINRDWMYITPNQYAYLRRLLNEAARYRCAPYIIDLRKRMLKSDASKSIDDLKAAITAAREKAK